jgi:hypothetical protein
MEGAIIVFLVLVAIVPFCIVLWKLLIPEIGGSGQTRGITSGHPLSSGSNRRLSSDRDHMLLSAVQG